MLNAEMKVLQKIELPIFVQPKQDNVFGLKGDTLFVATKIDDHNSPEHIYISEKKRWFPIDQFLIYMNIRPN